MKSIARNLSVSRAFPIFVGVFFCSYLFFSVLMPSNSNINISAKTPAQYKILAEIFGTPAEAGHSWISTRLNTDFSCPAGSTGVTYQNNPPDVGVANDQAQWFACYASPTALAGLYPSAPLLQQYFGPGWSGAGCESGSVPHVYNNYVGNDYDAIWVACSSPTPVPVVPTPPPVPTISQAQCTGTSITTAFSSVGASWYAVRLADLTSGSLISNGICDPASNSNETCQWQTGTSLNRTGIAGHTYRMWVHGATNTSWSSGTYSAAAYATDFSCPPSAVPVPPAPPAFTTSCPVPGTSMTSTSFYTPGATYYNLRVDSQSTSFTPSFINDPSCSSVNSGDTCINNYTGTSYSGSTTPTYYYDVWVHACNDSGCSPSATHNQYSRCFTVCSDNADNDGDGLTDMSDPGCSSPADNDEYNASVTYSCTGTTPANANICANDDSGLTANTGRTLVSSCTSGTKCEYVCSSGYVYSGGTCVLAGGGGPPAPTLSFGASPTSFPSSGGTTRLTWSTMNATSCSASGSWSGSKATGSGIWQDIPLSSSGSYTFSLECWNSASVSTGVHSATVTVAAAGGGGAGADLKINGQDGPYPTPISVPANSSVTVSWSSSGVAYCDTWLNDNGWRNFQGLTGSYTFTAPPAAADMTFQTLCNNTRNYFGDYTGAANNATTYDQEIMKIGPASGGGGGAPSGPVTTTLEVVCTPIACGSLAGVAATYCTTDTFSTPDPCGGSITCPGTKSCSNSDANWREVAP